MPRTRMIPIECGAQITETGFFGVSIPAIGHWNHCEHLKTASQRARRYLAKRNGSLCRTSVPEPGRENEQPIYEGKLKGYHTPYPRDFLARHMARIQIRLDSYTCKNTVSNLGYFFHTTFSSPRKTTCPAPRLPGGKS